MVKTIKYINNSLNNAEKNFTEYIDKVAKPEDQLIANFYLGMILDDNNRFNEALDRYNSVIIGKSSSKLKHYALSNKAFTHLELARNIENSEGKRTNYGSALSDFKEANSLVNEPNPINIGGLALVLHEMESLGYKVIPEDIKKISKTNKGTELSNTIYQMYIQHIAQTSIHEHKYSKKQYERMIERINSYFRTPDRKLKT